VAKEAIRSLNVDIQMKEQRHVGGKRGKPIYDFAQGCSQPDL
jgi:hypothetical protein